MLNIQFVLSDVFLVGTLDRVLWYFYFFVKSWSCGPMDKASDYESGDCRFESCQSQKTFKNVFLMFFCCKFLFKKIAPPGGLEPPTFRLTAERASQLRHGGSVWWTTCEQEDSICIYKPATSATSAAFLLVENGQVLTQTL